MTGQIIQLPGSPHRDVQGLLPWYVTGQLDASDTARVEGHVDGCAECRADLERERRLDRDLNRAPASVDAGWAMLRARLDGESRRPATARAAIFDTAAPRRTVWKWVGWAAGAQLATVALLVAVLVPGSGERADYQVLGAAAAPPAGNLVVIFRPETSEQQLRTTLRASNARLVDGPTAANAYILMVPGERRDRLAAQLRRQPQIVLAEPLDAGQRP